MEFWAVLPDDAPLLVVAFFKDQEQATLWRDTYAGGAAVRKVKINEYNLTIVLG